MSSNQSQFWPLDCIPKMLDGETLFSWCSLYHRISGSSFSGTTSKRLFDSSAGGFVRDFPGRIDHFVRVTEGLLGDADHIINEHTLLRLFSKFRSKEKVGQIRAMMRGNSVERLKFILGLPSSRASSMHPLKFCRECVAEEIEANGFARWWLNLQWPTVWICEKHNQLLHWARDCDSGSSKCAWFLPSELTSEEIVSIAPRIFGNTECLLEMTRLTTCMVNHEGSLYLPEILNLVFLEKLKERNYASSYGVIKYVDIRNDFLKKYEELSELPGMEFVQSIHQNDYGFLGTIIRGRNRYLHPSKYILMINYLFNSFKSFQSAYEKFAGTVDIDKTKMQILDPDRSKREQTLHQLIVVEGLSLNRVATIMNMSIVGVINWARKNGIAYKRRPRLETEELLLALKKLIDEGASRKQIASQLGVRPRWLTSFFGRHQELREKWEQRNTMLVTQQRRATFQKLIEEHQGVPFKELMLIPSNGYSWLKKHDRQWLQANLPELAQT